MKQFIITLFFLSVSQVLMGQKQFSDNPINAQFVTTDYDNFWKAFDKIGLISENPFIEYLNHASDGLKPFVNYFNVDTLYQTSKPIVSGIDSIKKKVEASYAAMKYWYPEARFPPVYFAVGVFSTGGTVSENGLLIGSEKLKNLNGLNALISHELIHYQQRTSGDNNLLKQVIREGSADFLGELISGEHINSISFNYGNKHEKRLCKEFVSLMLKNEYTDWLYGTSGKDDRPKDLGYWIGYKITEAYFNKQTDKRKAVSDILIISG